MPFHVNIEKWCDLEPDTNAVTIGSDTNSFKELICARNDVVSRIDAIELGQSQGNTDGRVVALVAENSVEFISRFLASTYGKNCCFLLSSALKAAQIQTVCKDIKPDLCFSHPLLEGFEHRDCKVISSKAIADRPIVINEDGAKTPFLIGLTSGTTSRPKAFIRNRQSWQGSLAQSRAVFEVDAATTTVSPGPLAHGLSLYAMAETLSAGAHFISMEKFDPVGLAKLIKQHNAKRLVMVPTMLSALCKTLETQNIKLDQVTSIVSAGSKLDAALLKWMQNYMPNAKVFEYYGASELGFVTYTVRQSGDDADGTADVGQAFPGVELAIMDTHDERVANGQSGKVCVKSEYICDGYVSQKDDVGFSLVNGWASVGDVGLLNEDGKLVLAGREGDMIISGGNNIYPASVEMVLKSLNKVEDAIVMGMDDAHLGSKLVAIISGEKLHKTDVINHCQRKLAVYAIPKVFYYIQSWPMTESGKISKKTLMDWVSTKNDQLQRF